MAYLRVPPRFLPVFRKLLGFPPEALSALEAAVAKEQPTLKIRDLADSVAKSVPQIPASELYEILILLGSLSIELTRKENNLAKLLKEVEAAVAKEEDLCGLMKEGWPRVEPVLKGILSMEKTFGITAKARDVMTDHQRLMCEARILTDVRPIFLPEVGGSPTAAVVVHTLKVSFHIGKDLEEFFVAMDHEDLAELKKAVERAEQKEAALLKVWPSSIPVLRGVTHEH